MAHGRSERAAGAAACPRRTRDGWSFLLARALLAAAAALAYGPQALAAACATAASGNWSAAATWSAPCNVVGGPVAGDTVTIGAAHTVTLTGTAAATSVTITAPTAANGLTLGGNTLTLTGALTLSRPTTNNASTVSVGSGTLNAASISIAGGANANRVAQVTVSDGTINVSGSVSFSNTANQARFTSTGASSVNIGGDFGGGGTLATSGSDTFSFNGGVAQSLGAYTTYSNVVIANISGGASFAGTSTLTGNLSVNSGTLGIGAFTLTVGGDLTIANGATFSETGVATINIAGILQNGGTLSASTGVHTFSGTAKTLSGTNAIPSVTISGSYTNNGTLTVATALAGAGSLANGATGTLNLGGTSAITTLTASTAGNSVNYNGAAQAVKAISYQDLTISGSGAKSLAGATTVAGTLTLSAGTLAVGANTLSLDGAAIAGTPTNLTTTSSSSLSFGGSSNSVAIPTSVTALTNLTVNNVNGVAASADLTISGVLTLSGGVLSTGTNTLTLSASCAGSVSRSSGFVAGTLRLSFPTGSTSCTYDIGNGSTYAPIGINMVAATGGTLSASTTASEHPQIGTSGINWNKDANRYWTLWATGDTVSATSVGVTFNFVAGDLDAGATATSFVVAMYRSSAWTLPTPVTAAATATGVSGLGAISSASDFAVGEATPPSASYSIVVSNSAPCIAGTGQTTVTVTALDSGGNTITSYIKTVTLAGLLSGGGASSATWTLASANGSLAGSQYGYVAADAGVASFYLSDTVPESVTLRVSENGGSTSTTLGTAVQFGANAFTITNIDALAADTGGGVVAGRPHLLRITSACGTAYSGAKTLDGWYTGDAADPGGTAPQICATNGGGSCLASTGSCSGALPSSAPAVSAASNNLPALTFSAAGVASFCLASSDVGRYTLSLRDDSNVAAVATGTSASLSVRPFAIAVSNINQGGLVNPASNSAGGASSFVAGAAFSATVAGYLWSSAADTGANGLPGSVSLATLTAAGLASHYADTVTLATDASVATNFVPNGTGTSQGALSNGVVTVASGSGTAASLAYSEVGSFTLKATPSSNYLSGGDLSNRVAIYADHATLTQWVGRFRPDHFDTTLTQGCASGGFTYSAQNFAAASVTAMNALAIPTKTSNYDGSAGYAKAVTLSEANGVSGSLSATSVAAGSFSAGVATPTLKFILAGAATVPPSPATIKLRALDTDGVSSATGSEATALMRAGWLKLTSYAVSSASSLAIRVGAYYWGGNSWVVNAADSCTSIPASSVALYGYLDSKGAAGSWTTSASGPGTLSSGQGSITLAAPSPAGSTGSVNVAVNLGTGTQDSSCLSATHATMSAPTASLAHLRGKNGNCAAATTYSYLSADPSAAADPSATATFGVFTPESRKAVHIRELY